MRSNERLAELVDSYLAQRLDAVSRFELEELLRDSEAARREFWKLTETEGLLQEWGRTQQGVDHAVTIETAAPHPEWWKSRWLKRTAAIAALLILGTTLWSHQTKPRPRSARNDSVAVLTQVTGAVWRAGTAKFEAGQFIGTGNLDLESGWVVLQFVSGNEVMIGGPAKVHISSANEIDCKKGRLTIYQPTPSATFVVHTPSTKIEDIYQSVALRVSPQATEVLVDQGRASRRVENGGNSSVPEGTALRISRDGTLGEPVGLKEELTRQLHDGAQLRIASRALPVHWLATSKRQNQHPDLVLRYTFDDISPDLLRVPNQATHSSAGLDGTIGGGAIREGRWPYKKALELDRRFDGVRLTMQGSYETMTITAWIQIYDLDRSYNGIFLSDGIKQGGFHLQILNTGAFNCGVTVPGSLFPIYTSPPVVTKDSFGKWQHVAVVYNMHGKSLSQYLNGQLISSHVLKLSIPLQIRSGMLGNWDPTDDKHLNMIRNFRGRIDDFAIYQKPFSPDEINTLYQQGRN